jgi:hypothetical protein
MKPKNEQIFGVIRHILSAVGGYFIYKGYLSEDQAAQISGAMLATLATFWSIASK